ncbi:DUF6182 family protein [Streptomyces muensis]|uniref:DUF6182 family protein n=1 Tax=Streptomyces muensis TaxID=1077944 RepID=A0A9X1PYU5_STRM4|nr:DUF6182 family protein [Streptomyces muensis]MCF1594965.1 DUF6182 family protein [Streptomyces muensis]
MSGTPTVEPTDTELLTAAAQARARAVGDGLGDRAVQRGLTVAVAVADLDVAAFISGAAAFALATPADLADGWYRTFTRTVYLAGRPDSVAARHPHRYATADGDLAWYGPQPRGELRPLSRLLRAFRGPGLIDVPKEPLTVAVPGTPSGHVVDAAVATGGVSTTEYLVHVHHLIAEAALRGLVRPGDILRVEHRPALGTADFRDALDPTRAGSVQTRIAGGTAPDRPRLYGVLTSNRPEGGD